MNKCKMEENHIHLLKCLQSKIANTMDPAINPDDAQHMERDVQSATI